MVDIRADENGRWKDVAAIMDRCQRHGIRIAARTEPAAALMNRLQKKCFLASAGIHLLLALILIIGPGFISSKSKPDDLPILDFVPVKTVDELVAPGGGNPHVKTPPVLPLPRPPQPQPAAPPPQPQARPEKVRGT